MFNRRFSHAQQAYGGKRKKKKQKTRKPIPANKYTNMESGGFNGWSSEGIQRFNKTCRTVKAQRANKWCTDVLLNESTNLWKAKVMPLEVVVMTKAVLRTLEKHKYPPCKDEESRRTGNKRHHRITRTDDQFGDGYTPLPAIG